LQRALAALLPYNCLSSCKTLAELQKSAAKLANNAFEVKICKS
jgi:hypothetical protein